MITLKCILKCIALLRRFSLKKKGQTQNSKMLLPYYIRLHQTNEIERRDTQGAS